MSKKFYFCTVCKKEISTANKAKHERTKIHQRYYQYKGGDLQQTICKGPGLPWAKYQGEKHLPGYNYAGPCTSLDIRLDENDNPKPGEEPINKVDAAALKHDIAYRAEDIRSRQKADIDLIQDLNEIKNPTFREKLDRAIVKTAMKAKIMLGAGVDNFES